jgi:hypothetical protein
MTKFNVGDIVEWNLSYKEDERNHVINEELIEISIKLNTHQFCITNVKGGLLSFKDLGGSWMQAAFVKVNPRWNHKHKYCAQKKCKFLGCNKEYDFFWCEGLYISADDHICHINGEYPSWCIPTNVRYPGIQMAKNAGYL